MLKNKNFLLYFFSLFIGLLVFSGIIFYFFFLKVQKVEIFLKDIESQASLSSRENLLGYDTKEYMLLSLDEEERKKVEAVISESDWENLSLSAIDQKLKEYNIDPLWDTSDPWYDISPQEIEAIISESDWDELSFAEIDAKLRAAGLPESGNSLDPLYSLRPQEILEKYGETGISAYIGEKQIEMLDEVTHFYDSFLFLGIVVFSLIFWLFGAYFLLLKNQEPLYEAIEKQKRFVSDVSHEIRTPLALMRSDAEIMLKTEKIGKKDITSFIHTLIGDIDTLNHLTTTLLSLTKIESRNELKKEKIILSSFFESLEQKFQMQMGEKNISFQNTLSKDIYIVSDRWLLFQMFSIFFENAIKYSEKEKSTLTLSYETRKNGINLCLQDEWIGIDAKHLPFLFDRFYRVNDARNTPWFGIGLSLAQEIAKILEIQIAFESTLWVGTKVQLFLKNEK